MELNLLLTMLYHYQITCRTIQTITSLKNLHLIVLSSDGTLTESNWSRQGA